MSLGNPVVIRKTASDIAYEQLTREPLQRDAAIQNDEDRLQRLVEGAPAILPIREFLPSARSIYSLACEVPVDIGGDGRIDNLLVTDDAHLVVVETKLYRNPEAIRAVIAQVFQYAGALGELTLLQLEQRLRSLRRTSLLL